MSDWIVGFFLILLIAMVVGAIRGFFYPDVFEEKKLYFSFDKYWDDMNAPISFNRRLLGMIGGAIHYGLLTGGFLMLASLPKCAGQI